MAKKVKDTKSEMVDMAVGQVNELNSVKSALEDDLISAQATLTTLQDQLAINDTELAEAESMLVSVNKL